MDTITLTAFRERSRHIYEGLITALRGEEKYELPFTFSDMSGVLKLESAEGLNWKQREEIKEETTDLVMERIVRFGF